MIAYITIEGAIRNTTLLNTSKYRHPDLDSCQELVGCKYYAIDVACSLRGIWRLGVQPIKNIISLCKCRGIKVFVINIERNYLSFFDEQTKMPFIILNPFQSKKEMMFSCACALGHLMMHNHEDKNIYEQYSKIENEETKRFATAFLNPLNLV